MGTYRRFSRGIRNKHFTSIAVYARYDQVFIWCNTQRQFGCLLFIVRKNKASPNYFIQLIIRTRIKLLLMLRWLRHNNIFCWELNGTWVITYYLYKLYLIYIKHRVTTHWTTSMERNYTTLIEDCGHLLDTNLNVSILIKAGKTRS